MTKICKVCEYLDGFHNISISDYLNSAISQGINYKMLVKEAEKSNIPNHFSLPSKHLVEKHKSECLKHFTPIISTTSSSIEKEVKQDISIPDDFAQKSLFNRYKEFQEMFFQLLYVQTKNAVNLNHNVSKDNINTIKILYDMCFKNYADLSSLDLDKFNDKRSVESAGLSMIKSVISNCLVTDKEVLDIAKTLISNKLDVEKIEDDRIRHIFIQVDGQEGEIYRSSDNSEIVYYKDGEITERFEDVEQDDKVYFYRNSKTGEIVQVKNGQVVDELEIVSDNEI